MAETVFAVTQTPLGKSVRSLLVDQQALRSRGRVEAHREGCPSERILSVGIPIPGIRLRIYGDDHQELPDGVVGEVAVAAPFLFSEYFKNSGATAAALRDEWFLTGDMGCIVNGELFILGRRKEMIILYGKNFYANDLEYSTNRVAGIKPGRCVALGSFNAEAGSEELVVVAEVDPERMPEAIAIRKAIKQQLAQDFNLSPRDIRLVPSGWLLKTTSGKIARGENLEKYIRERRSPELVAAIQPR
jgi:acyl-CoA synthetase (AMP-forming)/AMP-acid ligase II